MLFWIVFYLLKTILFIYSLVFKVIVGNLFRGFKLLILIKLSIVNFYCKVLFQHKKLNTLLYSFE